uniref:Stathmin n=1 Tax=Hucho hucho TaxID=62062 RepID=A0A4W5MRY0_9TELE
MEIECSGMEVKPINKRASGQAFEVILKPPSPMSDAAHCVTSPPKREVSLEDIQKKLEAAEDRRRVSHHLSVSLSISRQLNSKTESH